MHGRDRDWQLDKNVGGATKRKIIKQGQRAAYQHKVDWNFKIYYKRVQWIIMAFAVEVLSNLKKSKPGQKGLATLPWCESFIGLKIILFKSRRRWRRLRKMRRFIKNWDFTKNKFKPWALWVNDIISKKSGLKIRFFLHIES